MKQAFNMGNEIIKLIHGLGILRMSHRRPHNTEHFFGFHLKAIAKRNHHGIGTMFDLDGNKREVYF